MVVVDDAILSSTYFTGRPTIERKPANVGTLCMKNFEPAAAGSDGTTLSLLVGIFNDPAISQWK